MVAELAPRPSTPSLLLNPDQPPAGVPRTFGWRWTSASRFTVLERRPQDDDQGAVVQWIVLRYYRDGVLRKALAQEYGFSERRVQEYLTGKSGTLSFWHLAYAAPVLRALTRLGFPVRERCNRRRRLDTQANACRAALLGVADLIEEDARPRARRLRRDIALLTREAGDGC